MQLEHLYKVHYGRLLAGLIRLTHDVQLAEDALQEAFASAIAQGLSAPESDAGGWIFSTARHKAIDRLRKRAFEAQKGGVLADIEDDRSNGPAPEDPLRLLFTCCHPEGARGH